MTRREWALVKEAVTQTRYEAGLKAAPPGPDSWRTGPGKVDQIEVRAIRGYIRAALAGDMRTMRLYRGSDDS